MSENESIRKMLTCIYCKRVPQKPPLYTCRMGHTACEPCLLPLGSCEKRPAAAAAACPECGHRIDTRHLIGEELLKHLHMLPTGYGAARPAQPQPRARPRTKSVSSTSISRRPIYCPISDCGKMIAVTQLVAHFAFEHARIHQEHLEYRQPKSLALSLNNMEYGKSHCLALLLLADDDRQVQTAPPAGYGVAFPLLAARLQCVPDGCNAPAEDARPPPPPPPADRLQFHDTDMLLVWLCTNWDARAACSLEMSDEKRSRVLSYHGPANSLRDDNRPGAVFARADCLTAHATCVRNITQHGHCPIEMSVAVLSTPREPVQIGTLL